MTKLMSLAVCVLVLASCADSGGGEGAAQSGGEATPLALDVWYEISATTGRGLRVGSGLRFRVAGFDVASGDLAQVMDGTCTLAAGAIDCEAGGGPLHATQAADGTVSVTQGPNTLSLVLASSEAGRAFDATLAAHVAQTTACNAAGACCVDGENERGLACDLNARLGDRSAASCQRALEAIRAELASGELPASCR